MRDARRKQIMEKKKLLRILSLVLVIALLTGTVGVIAYGAGANKSTDVVSTEKTSEKATITDTLNSVIDAERTVGKEETVYVLADANGAANKVIVSNWLKNTDHSATISDKTDLKDVENVKGDESYSIDKDNMYAWNADGNDIYYQGTTDMELPVDLSISYKLDGKTVSAEELAGKSGKVTMHFDYTNKQKETVQIDGKKEEIYVPFIMLTGMILDNESFQNISVSNGKLVNDGDRSIVVGFAMPGLKENLDVTEAEMSIPDYVEITADVTDFSLTTTLTLATNDVFNNLDFGKVNSLDTLSSALSDLQTASNALVDGSSTLYEGISTLLDKSGLLVSGIQTLYNGASKVSDGASTVSSGAATLNSGANTLNAGLKQLSESSDTLNAGAKQVFESILSTADSQLAAAGLNVSKLTVDNYESVLGGVLGSLDKDAVYNMAYNTAYATVSEAVNAQSATIRAQVQEAVHAQVLSGVLSSLETPMTSDEYSAGVAAGTIPAEVQSQITAAVDAQMSSGDISAQIDSLTAGKIDELIQTNMQSADVQSQIAAAVAQAQSGAGSIQSLLSELRSYQTFYDGLLAYTGGTDEAYAGSNDLLAGTNDLAAGAAELSTGAEQVYTGIGTLLENTNALLSGVSELKEGAMQLSTGMETFNEEGIQKLVNAWDGDFEGLITRFKATVDVSKDYQTFSGKADGVEGSVKFIYRTDSI